MRRFSFTDPGFEAAFAAFVDERRETPEEVDAAVRDVLAAVRAEGLDAVLRFSRQFDRANVDETTIRVTAEVPGAVVVLAMSREPSGQSRVEVRDNGPGIAEDRREDIFLPFYTTHKGGSGVGLSFARQVALAHGGSICALDAPEGGANLRMVI